MSGHGIWVRLLKRISGASVIAGVLLAIPDYDSGAVLRYKNAIIAFAFVVSLGKILYDTLFYDRYSS
jgi:hypothetical protein